MSTLHYGSSISPPPLPPLLLPLLPPLLPPLLLPPLLLLLLLSLLSRAGVAVVLQKRHARTFHLGNNSKALALILFGGGPLYNYLVI